LKATQRPTTERLLKAFDNITLTILNIQGEEYGYVTPLNQVQKKILRLLGLDPEIYSSKRRESWIRPESNIVRGINTRTITPISAYF
jgi:hypothetical protein